MPKGIYDRTEFKKPKQKELGLMETVASVPTDTDLRFAELMTIVKDTNKMVKKLFDALHGEPETAASGKRRGPSLKYSIMPLFDDGEVHSVYEVWQKLGAHDFKENSISTTLARLARESALERVRSGLYRNPNVKTKEKEGD